MKIDETYKLVHKPRFKKTISLINKPFKKDDQVLDIGCGDGGFAILLKEKYPFLRIFLSDKDYYLKKDIQKKFKFNYLGNANFEKLPFSDNSFDVVFCLEVIEHLYDPDFLINEIYRVLKPNGRIIITTPNLAAWTNRLLLLFGFYPRGQTISIKSESLGYKDIFSEEKKRSYAKISFDYHIRIYTIGALETILKAHRFKIIKKTGFYAFKSRQGNIFISLLHFIFEKTFPYFSQAIYIEASK